MWFWKLENIQSSLLILLYLQNPWPNVCFHCTPVFTDLLGDFEVSVLQEQHRSDQQTTKRKLSHVIGIKSVRLYKFVITILEFQDVKFMPCQPRSRYCLMQECQPKVLSKPLTLDLIFWRACYHWNASYGKKNRQNESCRKTLDLQTWFCSFLVHDSSKEATELAKKCPKFLWGLTLEDCMVAYSHTQLKQHHENHPSTFIFRTCVWWSDGTIHWWQGREHGRRIQRRLYAVQPIEANHTRYSAV